MASSESLFEHQRKAQAERDAPLAERMRPRTFEEFVGQEQILGPDRVLPRSIAAGRVPSFVLWGPPGTGKTYRTMAAAVRLCLDLDADDALLKDANRRGELKAEYEKLRAAGQISFVTFHQSYSYEDFVEGLRPKALSDGPGFELKAEPGIFRLMAEAAESSPEQHVIVIDEMSTELEALAARTIAERGVQLVATAHGNTLSNVVSNPTLSDLAGGTQTVTLGDIEARRRRTQKTVLERKHDPTFDIVVEIRERNVVTVHPEVGIAVDRMLRGISIPQEERRLQPDGSVETQIKEIPGTESEFTPAPFEVGDVGRNRSGRGGGGSRDWPDQADRIRGGYEPGEVSGQFDDADAPKPVVTKVFPFGIPKSAINEIIVETNSPVAVVDFADAAEIFVTTKSHYSRRPTAVRRAERDGVMVHVLRRGTKEQIKQFLKRFSQNRIPAQNGINADYDDLEQGGRAREALKETESAIGRVVSGERRVELMAQPPFVRRLQHGLAARNNLGSASMGKEPSRRVVIRRRKR